MRRHLAGFLVDRVLVAPAAVFLVFDTPRLLALVLGRGIVASFALGTFQRNNFSHDNLRLLSLHVFFQGIFAPEGWPSGLA